MILFLGVIDDYPEQKSSLPVKKEKDCELLYNTKITTKIILKEGSYRTSFIG